MGKSPVVQVTTPDAVVSDSPLVQLLGIRERDGWSCSSQPVHAVGNLSTVDGVVHAGDGACWYESPLGRRIPPGAHPVYVIHATNQGGVGVAFAVLVVGKDPIVTWLPDPIRAGYAVDSGLGGFWGGRLAAAYSPIAEAHYDHSYGKTEPNFEQVIEVMDGKRRVMACQIALAGDTGVVFSSGVGDGWYRMTWGLDAAGKPQVLVVDFDLLGWAEEKPRSP